MTKHRNSPEVVSSPRRRGFSLIEMMVVLGILAVVLGIVIPAVNAARTSARKAATQQTMSSLSQATNQFILDERRTPGYFSMRELASSENANRGFTAMDNLLLDLAGAITTQAPVNGNGQPCDIANGPKVVAIGPTVANRVNVDLATYGSTKQKAGVQTKGYLQVDTRNFKRQCTPSARAGAVNDHLALPMIVDAFGDPILAWVQDEVLAPNSAFASDNYTMRARFYWTTNKAFLQATSLGETKEDQTNATSGSLLNLNNAAAFQSMEALLGSPASPNPTNPAKAADARGKLVFHSAGHDGIYVGRKERGGKSAPPSGLPYQQGRDYTSDGSFDDLFQTVQ